jgi:magnesium transporter
MEFVGNEIESMEDELQENPSPEIVRKMREIKRELILIRSSIWPMRELINSLQREEPKVIAETTQLYLRDVYDHTIQVADIVESYRDILSEMFNVYLSVTANNTNEVMRVLTIFATIFIPLTFIAGIYGMNFEFMPELKWRPAYFVMLGLMAVITIALLRFFRKRGWM